jgi:hypothetical protein
VTATGIEMIAAGITTESAATVTIGVNGVADAGGMTFESVATRCSRALSRRSALVDARYGIASPYLPGDVSKNVTWVM